VASFQTWFGFLLFFSLGGLPHQKLCLKEFSLCLGHRPETSYLVPIAWLFSSFLPWFDVQFQISMVFLACATLFTKVDESLRTANIL
jgi:hypothetical protein